MVNAGVGDYGEYGAEDFLFENGRVFGGVEDDGWFDAVCFDVDFATDDEFAAC